MYFPIFRYFYLPPPPKNVKLVEKILEKKKERISVLKFILPQMFYFYPARI